MSFSNDRDLLAVEPAIFEDVPFTAQRRLHVTDAAVSGTTLTSATADFVTAGVDAGSVILISGIAHEVVERTDANTLEVSLPRAKSNDSAIPGGDGTDLEVEVRTFAPQAELVHDGLLRLVGIDPDQPDGEITEASVLSPTLLSRIESLGTLEMVYSAAASLMGDNDTLLMKAGEYRRRHRMACNSAVVLIDTDGDGEADLEVPLGSVRFERM